MAGLLDFGKEHVYNKLVLPPKRGKKDEVFEQFSIILLFSFLGELLRRLIPLPIPASVYGLVLMLAALGSGILKAHQVRETAGFLIEIMPVMFIPAGVGLLDSTDALLPVWIPVVVITVVTTVLVMAVTGGVTQSMLKRGKKKMNEFLSNSVFFGAVLSLAAYETGLLLKKKFKMAILNPLLIGTICVMAVLMIFKVDYKKYNESAKYISYLLTPATVCLAVPLYEQMSLLKKNFRAVAVGIVSAWLASLVSVLALSRIFGLSHELYVTLLPKSITTAIGMGVSEELGGIVTITVAVIIITGILGNVIRAGLQNLSYSESHCQRAGSWNRLSCHWNCQSHGDGTCGRRYEQSCYCCSRTFDGYRCICVCRLYVRRQNFGKISDYHCKTVWQWGRQIGRELAERLEIPFYGKEELMEIARGREDYEEVRAFYEEQPVNSLLYAIAMNQSENQVGKIPFKRIRSFAERSPAYSLAGAGNYIFREEENCIRIFIYADMKTKQDWVMKHEGLSAHRAKAKIQEIERGKSRVSQILYRRSLGQHELL